MAANEERAGHCWARGVASSQRVVAAPSLLLTACCRCFTAAPAASFALLDQPNRPAFQTSRPDRFCSLLGRSAANRNPSRSSARGESPIITNNPAVKSAERGIVPKAQTRGFHSMPSFIAEHRTSPLRHRRREPKLAAARVDSLFRNQLCAETAKTERKRKT